MNSLTITQEITCSNCQHLFEFTLWVVIDLTEHPHLWATLQAGRLHTLICPNCEAELGTVDTPLLLYNPLNNPVLIFSAAQQTNPDQDQEQFHQLLGYLAQQLQANWTPDWLEKQLKIIPRPHLIHFVKGDVAQIPTFLQQLLQQIRQLTDPSQYTQRITHIQQALQLIDHKTQPRLWGALHMEWGNSLAQNPLENRTENLEQAIEAYQRALIVYTPELFPEQWAILQNNLADVYLYRLMGNRAENLERAIEYYQQALTIYTPEDFPEDWADTQNNLAKAYEKRMTAG